MNFDVTCYAADDNDYPHESMADIVFGAKPTMPPKQTVVAWRHTYGALVEGRATPVPVSDIERITAALAAAGITPTRAIVEAKGATKRPGPKPSYAIVVPSGAVIPANVWELFEDRPYKNGNLIVVQLKVS